MELYDLYEKNEPTNTFRMRAPLQTIDIYLGLKKEAVQRIKRECAIDAAICTLYIKVNIFFVQRALSDLGTER